jgi:putative membrane protein
MRQVITMIIPEDANEAKEVQILQKRMVYRHIAFTHALLVFLKKKLPYNETKLEEIFVETAGRNTGGI